MFSVSQNVDLLIDQFDDDFEEGGSLPYVQIINASGKIKSKIDKDPLAYGLCINEENAEAVNFKPSVSFAEGSDIPIHAQSTAVIDRGWVARDINMVVVAASDIEVQEKVENGDRSYWRFVDVAYRNGSITHAGETAKNDDTQTYRRVRRYLVFLLDDQLKPLHDSPLQLTGRGGFGASLSKEYGEFQSELGAAYRAAAKANGRTVKRGRLSKDAQSFTVFPFQMGYSIPSDANRSTFSCISGRYSPTANAIEYGVKKVVKQGDREVEVTAQPYSAFIVAKDSDLGKMIASAKQEYPQFAEPNRGNSTVEVGGDQPFSEQGSWDLSTVKYNHDASIDCVLVTDAERVPVVIPPNLSFSIDQVNLTVYGFMPSNGGSVKMTRFEGAVEEQAANEKELAGISF